MSNATVKEVPVVGTGRRLVVTGLILVACFLLVALLGSQGADDPQETSSRCLPFALMAFVPFLLACDTVRRVKVGGGLGHAVILLVFAAVLRGMLLPVTPFLSDDIYRYVWEGRIQLSGFNPYLLAPDAPELEPLRDAVWQGVNHKSISTIYPPVMQLFFRLVAAAGGGILGMKAFLVIVDLLLVVVLMDLLAALKMNPLRAIFYAWNPLVILEVAGSGHNDPLSILLVVVTVRFLVAAQSAAAVASITLAGMAKILPFLLLPFLLCRRVRPRHLLLVPALVGVLVYPYIDAGSSLLHGAGQYAERWRHNDFLFGGLLRVVGWFLSPDPTYHLEVAKTIAASIILLAGAVTVVRRMDPIATTLVLLGLCVALSPTVHPWYVLWVLPWICFRARPSWMWLNASVLLSYVLAAVAADPGAGAESTQARILARADWITALEWGPWLALFGVEIVFGLTRRGREPEVFAAPTGTERPRSQSPPGTGAGTGS